MTAQIQIISTDQAKTETADPRWKSLYTFGGAAALVALSANLLDVILGFGETDIIVNGTKTAQEWFALFQENWFKGIYVLGILNIVYMLSMIPVYFAIFGTHNRQYRIYAGLAMVICFIGMAIYISNNAAIPMFVLSSRYAAAAADTQRASYAAAGEAILARGEDFTPGSFIGLISGGIAAIGISFVMLKGGLFGKANAWIGITGFTFLSIFTIWSTFIPVLYNVAFYFFGMIGGLCALAWFILTARRLLQLGAD